MTHDLLLSGVLQAGIASRIAAPFATALGANLFSGAGWVTGDAARKQPVA